MKAAYLYLFLFCGICSGENRVDGSNISNIFSNHAKALHSKENQKNSFGLIPEWSESDTPYSYFSGMSADRKESVEALRSLFDSLNKAFKEDFVSTEIIFSKRKDSVSYFGYNLKLDGKLFIVTAFFTVIDESSASLTFSVIESS